MISSAIRIVSKAVCVLLITSFAMFVVDELTTATSQQMTLAKGSTKAQVVRDIHGREFNPQRSDLRTKIDNANDAILGPAESALADQNPWVMLGVPFLLGLLLFGLGGHMLANWLEVSPTNRIGPKPLDHEFRPRYTPGYR